VLLSGTPNATTAGQDRLNIETCVARIQRANGGLDLRAVGASALLAAENYRHRHSSRCGHPLPCVNLASWPLFEVWAISCKLWPFEFGSSWRPAVLLGLIALQVVLLMLWAVAGASFFARRRISEGRLPTQYESEE
jgi:hypothetical protein